MTRPDPTLPPDQEMEAVRRALLEVYRPEGAEIWLRSPNPMLDGGIPEQLIKEGRHREVMAVIAALADGAFW